MLGGAFALHVAKIPRACADSNADAAIEAEEGVRRARAEAAASHLTLLLLDGNLAAARFPHGLEP